LGECAHGVVSIETLISWEKVASPRRAATSVLADTAFSKSGLKTLSRSSIKVAEKMTPREDEKKGREEVI
jgi:hypothetical protein